MNPDLTSKQAASPVVEGFGKEWRKFDQSGASDEELGELFRLYFSLFPWDRVGSDAVGLDVGCGSGRWARIVAPRVGRLYCVDASAEALEVAGAALRPLGNCEMVLASAEHLPFPDNFADFGYCLGVLHHTPDTAAGMKECGRILKPGAPFLVYLYYAFDNRPGWFRALWRISNLVRGGISRLPFGLRAAICEVLAALVYFPLARTAALAEKMGVSVDAFPLSAYRKRTFYMMRNDALDRFGTALEKRFTRREIEDMMKAAGMGEIRFREEYPYWCAVGYKR